MGHPRICIKTVWTECACDWRCHSCRVAPWTSLVWPAHVLPLGCSHLDLLMPQGWFAAHHSERRNLWVSPEKQPWGSNSESLLLLCSNNVGAWNSRPGVAWMQRCSFLCPRSLRLPEVQGPAGLDRGWGQRAAFSRFLSAFGVIVNRHGSHSDRCQRRANASSRRRTRGWQLFGLHRYSCRFRVFGILLSCVRPGEKVEVVLDGDKRKPLMSFLAFLSVISTKSFLFEKRKREGGITLSPAVFGFIFKNDKSVWWTVPGEFNSGHLIPSKQ